MMLDVGQIMAYEDGQLDYDQVIDLFQNLIDSGLAWQLQGSYGRASVRLIESGECQVARPNNVEFFDAGGESG